MTATANRRQPAPRKEIWSALLKSVSSGKRLAEKQLIILGSNPDSQREFIHSLDNTRSNSTFKAPIANQFALGYTYQDVPDADHEDILARLSIYTLSTPSPQFVPLLKPLLNASTIPNTLLVILLDWSTPWLWLRQLRSWIRLLHTLLKTLSKESLDALHTNIDSWRSSKRDDSAVDEDIPLGPGEYDAPLGLPLCVVCQNSDQIDVLEKDLGWKDRHFDFIQQFLRTVLLKHGGSLVYTLPHSPDTVTSLQRTIHASLGIQQSLLGLQQQQQQQFQQGTNAPTNIITPSTTAAATAQSLLKHNVTERDKILVPPAWDSWGKIRILTDEFLVESVSNAWSASISKDFSAADYAAYTADPSAATSTPSSTSTAATTSPSQTSDSAEDIVNMYAEVIPPPPTHAVRDYEPRSSSTAAAAPLALETKDTQAFLAEQAGVLAELAREDEKSTTARDTTASKRRDGLVAGAVNGGNVEEHIGPVQFNMGGIQMDAEDMVKRLKDREANRSTSPLSPTKCDSPQTPPVPSTISGTPSGSGPAAPAPSSSSSTSAAATATATAAAAAPAQPASSAVAAAPLSSRSEFNDMENKDLANFFAGLIKPKGGAAVHSPKMK